MTFLEWARKWGVPEEAVRDYLTDSGCFPAVRGVIGASEAAVQQQIRLEASRRGVALWRNNRGAAMDERGVPVRYGLANDSKELDARIKSSDLIGVTPLCGLAVFTSYEVKRRGWRYAGTPREVAQLAWIDLIKRLGGIAKFITSPDDICY